ncbi:MBL fold metallo-hydrolase [Mucilaginibacter sp. Bleaf8]|uniref:MBL fold metallo-hydrolase n=1 Tax=Mucilaginibacter sp. Bleaf8 TaxID=2834430 RepID=UPI001BCE6898|nr:MBL fold metallo-hydrolase [Mucilaginibacter sp. Bleaf8]MBS7564642.1 MBL fold metallo-hydrolase [Mucilaginibacter sp. Bleaf8]
MALYITSLNSGSNGNCYYVGNQHDAVLVDVGISCREVEKRMLRLGLNIRKVRAIFVSHEHSDHIRGIAVLSKKYQLPVYITPATHRYCGLQLEAHLVRPLQGYEAVHIGELAVIAFPKFHDAAEPHSFVVSCKEINIGVFTDIGAPCDHLIQHFKKCHAAFLEANYDEQMLAQGRYPYHLKKRISGGHGHLSNRQALELFKTHKPLFMSHLLLSHLSKDNNCPDLARNLFNAHAGGTQIIVASRYEETPVYQISDQEPRSIELSSVTDDGLQQQFSLF